MWLDFEARIVAFANDYYAKGHLVVLMATPAPFLFLCSLHGLFLGESSIVQLIVQLISA
jgi:hypothetical protein